MIKEIKLHNFQKHSDLTWKLDPRVNVLTGSSDQGKSTIYRALYWLVFNRPVGSDVFKKFGMKDYFVEIILEDDTVIRRGKDKEGSYYTLNGERFSGIGTDVPRPIQEKLNMNSLNFSGQFDAPFLIGLSRPEASRYIASLVHLDEMEKALSNIESKRRKSDNDIGTVEEKVKENKTEIEALKKAPKMMKAAKQLQSISDTLSLKREDSSKIQYNIDSFTDLSTRADILKTICESFPDINAILEKQQQISVLTNILEQYRKNNTSITNLEHISRAESLMKSLSELQSVVTTAKQKYKDFKQSHSNLTQVTDSLETISKEIKPLQKIWDEKMKDSCPLCGAKL